VNMLINVAAVFVFFGAGVFVATYHLLAPWWRSHEGINIMAFTSSVLGFALLRCLTMIFGAGFWGQDVLRLVLLVGVGATVWHRWRMLMKAQLMNLNRES